MNEHVGTALALNESISLGVIEPLDGSGFALLTHRISPKLSGFPIPDRHDLVDRVALSYRYRSSIEPVASWRPGPTGGKKLPTSYKAWLSWQKQRSLRKVPA
ncbi:hypothetical protein RCF34_07090 [Pseudomonas sp. 102515]|uniref:hypothetical protein n=1 Tax=Pseudomonas sp. 102515 TaxID=3071568 RepID=UPI002800DF38|nr:hypothetical protein [Pseudomonas sp. 102515]MDQ7912876.1 hypothetical protein [Pseudomonas sp. 102515]